MKKQLSLEDEISGRLAVFAHEIANLARVRTLEQLRGAFAEGIQSALDKSAAKKLQGFRTELYRAVVAHKPGRPSKSARVLPKGAKRDAKALEQLKARLVRYLGKQPGSSVEEIARGLQCSTKALVLPINKALATGEITKKGARRGTRYSAA